jgi:hypothetical protein
VTDNNIPESGAAAVGKIAGGSNGGQQPPEQEGSTGDVTAPSHKRRAILGQHSLVRGEPDIADQSDAPRCQVRRPPPLCTRAHAPARTHARVCDCVGLCVCVCVCVCVCMCVCVHACVRTRILFDSR